MPFSPLVHLIALALVGWFYWTARRIDQAAAYRGTTLALTIAMLAWIALATWLALDDFFYVRNERFLAVIVATAVPFAAILGAWLLVPAVRGLLRLLVRRLTLGQTIAVQAVRVTAAGTIFKMVSGVLPVHFVVASGVPDLLVGLSALYVARHAHRLSDRLLVAWNIAGALVFLVALATMQLSLPGPFQVFAEEPTARMVVSFPMVLVPTFIGPMLILIHVLSLAQVVRRSTPAFG